MNELLGRYLQFTNGLKNNEIYFGDRGIFITQPPQLNSVLRSTTVTENINYLEQPWDLYSQTHELSPVVSYHKFQPENNETSIHRVFQWLNYIPGIINQVSLNGIDVLSGFFSGCWLMHYKIDGIVYVGHVGTEEDATHQNTIISKRAWNNFAQQNPKDVVGGFKPEWKGIYPAKVQGELRGGDTKRMGLVTTSGRYYTVLAYQQNNFINPNTPWRIAGIQEDYSAELGVLQNI
jgi:hypothetical protein